VLRESLDQGLVLGVEDLLVTTDYAGCVDVVDDLVVDADQAKSNLTFLVGAEDLLSRVDHVQLVGTTSTVLLVEGRPRTVHVGRDVVVAAQDLVVRATVAVSLQLRVDLELETRLTGATRHDHRLADDGCRGELARGLGHVVTVLQRRDVEHVECATDVVVVLLLRVEHSGAVHLAELDASEGEELRCVDEHLVFRCRFRGLGLHEVEEHLLQFLLADRVGQVNVELCSH